MEELFQKIRHDFGSNLSILEDKPEETVDSTIKALWNKAFGISISATKAAQLPLPQLTEQQKANLLQLAEKRINGTPLAHLTGRQNFMGIEFLCDKRALIPRKETEILGQSALEICKKIAKKKTILNLMDVCCGSGNLGLTLASLQPDTIVYSSDQIGRAHV